MDVESLIRRAYAAFNRRDIDGALSLIHPDVDWPNAWEGGRVRGHDGIRDYWTRQWEVIDPHVEPVSFQPGPDGTVAVLVRQVVRDRDGALLSEGVVTHRHRLRDGLIARMDVERG